MGFVIAGWVLFSAADFHPTASMLCVLLGGAGSHGRIIAPGLFAAGQSVLAQGATAGQATAR